MKSTLILDKTTRKKTKTTQKKKRKVFPGTSRKAQITKLLVIFYHVYNKVLVIKFIKKILVIILTFSVVMPTTNNHNQLNTKVMANVFLN